MPRFSIKHFATAALLLIPTLGRAQTLTDAEQTSVEQWMQAYDTVNSSLLVTINIDGKDRVIEQQQTLHLFAQTKTSFASRKAPSKFGRESGPPIFGWTPHNPFFYIGGPSIGMSTTQASSFQRLGNANELFLWILLL